MTVVFIGLGSNMEQPIQQVQTALGKLKKLAHTRMLGHSSLYRSKPVGPQDQDDFINAVAKLDSGLSPEALLDALQSIEQEHDRKRTRRWGPRTLDLDILAYGDEQIDTDRLSVPHPEIPNRGFVLVPWLEIESDWNLPGMGQVSELLAGLDEAKPERLP